MKLTSVFFIVVYFLLSQDSYAQRIINVKLMDFESHLPVRLATFRLSGKKIVADPADRDGYFKLNVDSADTLEIEALSYETKIIAIPQRDDFFITLNRKNDSYEFLPVDVQATFPGGLSKFYEYIAKHIKYPKEIKHESMEGRVFVQFVINEDGNMDQTSILVLRGIHPLCDEEAVRVIKDSPQWIPAMRDNKPVRQRFVIPIIFSSKLAKKK